jgi:hypothetical protein
VEDVPTSDPFGTEYGAGPSRLPYHRSSALRSPETARFAGSKTILAARALRLALGNLSHGAHSRPDIFFKSLPGKPDSSHLSRLELHALLHHLIRNNRFVVAAGIINAVIEEGLSRNPKKRRKIARKTIVALFRAAGISRKHGLSEPSVSFHAHPAPSIDGTSASSRHILPRIPTPQLNVLLALHKSLQNIRHRRPPELYKILIRLCCAQRLYDIAAKVFVGLVEEWVTEGRIAEGADLEDFYEGGGPPREWRPEISQQLKGWWKGVRTWRLPGEVLSPHDRLDLWHPQKLSLGEKMRSFPFPLATSPPSIVPEPADEFLGIILSSLRLDPAISDPRDFAASMRALAILANTVLCRTLPILSVGHLLRAFKSTVSNPPIYPADLPESVPEDKAWAYEAYTHIHLALQSLFFSPPMSSSSLNLASQHAALRATGDINPPPAQSRYATPPLSFDACMKLVHYALGSLGTAKILRRLVSYMKDAYDMGRGLPVVWNLVFRRASSMRDNHLAQQAEDALFGSTPLSRRTITRGKETNAYEDVASIVNDGPQLLLPIPVVAPQPDEDSVLALINHLGVTSQFDRLEQLTYRLIPFLNSSKSRLDLPGSLYIDDVGESGRPRPAPLSPKLYAALLASLERAGKTGLAQRIYTLALDAEKYWATEHEKLHPTTFVPLPNSLRLPIGLFTSMLLVWENEVSRGVADYAPPTGWRAPRGMKQVPAFKAAGCHAIFVYRHARARWQAAEVPSDIGVMTPNARFFDAAFRACAKRWGLDVAFIMSKAQKEELGEVLLDMEEFGVEVPNGVKKKWRGAEMALQPTGYKVWRKAKPVKEFAAVLAEMQIEAMRATGAEVGSDQETWEFGPVELAEAEGADGATARLAGVADAEEHVGSARGTVERTEVVGASRTYWQDSQEVRKYASL